jgi:hypothetical protein
MVGQRRSPKKEKPFSTPNEAFIIFDKYLTWLFPTTVFKIAIYLFFCCGTFLETSSS